MKTSASAAIGILLFLAILIIPTFASAQKPSADADPVKLIVGKWQGTVPEGLLTVIFAADGDYMMMTTPNGEKAGEPQHGKYKVDASKKPAAMEFSGRDQTFHVTVVFHSDTEMVISDPAEKDLVLKKVP